MRQKAEYSRLNEQVADVRRIRDELESGRVECVRKLTRVEQVLGVKSDYI